MLRKTINWWRGAVKCEGEWRGGCRSFSGIDTLQKDARVNWTYFPAERAGFLSTLEEAQRPAICVGASPGLPLVTLADNCWTCNCCVQNSMTPEGKPAAPTLLDWILYFFGSHKNRKVTFHLPVETFDVTPNSFIFFRPLHLKRHVWQNSRHPSWFCPTVWTQLPQSPSGSIWAPQETVQFQRKNTVCQLSFVCRYHRLL